MHTREILHVETWNQNSSISERISYVFKQTKLFKLVLVPCEVSAGHGTLTNQTVAAIGCVFPVALSMFWTKNGAECSVGFCDFHLIAQMVLFGV